MTIILPSYGTFSAQVDIHFLSVESIKKLAQALLDMTHEVIENE